jgi:hypothetical protein
MAAFYDLGVTAELTADEMARANSGLVLHGRWKQLIPKEQWSVFQRVVRKAREHGLEFAFGGAFAVATYTGKWRDTKDMDLYILPEDCDRMKAVLDESGLSDYFPVKDYDRSWIYRGHDGEVIVDIIWSMANHRAEVDREWLRRGPVVAFGKEQAPVIPPEELIWSKLYVLQKDRSDWPDVLNILHAVGPALDWSHLFERLGDDLLLLDGVLSVFRWLVPERAADLPSWVWRIRDRVERPPAEPCERVRLLDSRPWFRPLEAAGNAEEETPC